MKKILIFALLLVFAAFPVFSQATVGGELEYYMVSGFDPEEEGNFKGNLEKAEVNFNVPVGDYNTVSVEIEASSKDAAGKPFVHMNYAVVETDWAMMFGLEGFTITTIVGLDGFETFDNVDFTGLGYENADNYDNIGTNTSAGFKIILGFVDDLIMPYYSMAFDTSAAMRDNGADWFVGAGFDFGAINIPLWLEVYYGGKTGYDFNDMIPSDNKYNSNQLGIEASYAIAIGEEMGIDLGGFFQLNKFPWESNTAEPIIPPNESESKYGFGVAYSAFGAAIGVSFMGSISDNTAFVPKDESYAFSLLGVDAEYFFLEWLGINVGASFAFGDYAEDNADSVFQTFEIGIVVSANEDISYRLGYMYDASANATSTEPKKVTGSRTLNTDGTKNATGGGLYFAAILDF